MIPERFVQVECCLCAEKHPPVRTLGISVPAIVVPIVGWPVPLYLQFRGALCHSHTASFTLAKFTDYYGAWYDMVGDQLRDMRKPAVNPFPDDPNFKWSEFIINPRWEPVPIAECYVQFWDPKSLAAKGATARLW